MHAPGTSRGICVVDTNTDPEGEQYKNQLPLWIQVEHGTRCCDRGYFTHRLCGQSCEHLAGTSPAGVYQEPPIHGPRSQSHVSPNT